MLNVNKPKYSEVLLHILASPANNSRLGKVKLMKLLYFADFDHYEKFGESITGDSYVHLDFGPVPRSADIVLRMLDDSGAIKISRTNDDFPRYVYELRDKSAASPPYQHLSLGEIETLDCVIEKWRNASRRDIVLASHGEPPWRMTDYGEEIPFHLVYYRDNAAGQLDEEPSIPREVNRSRLAS